MQSELRSVLVLLVAFAAVAIAAGLLVDFDAGAARRLLESSRERPAWSFALVVGVLATDSVLTVPTVATVLAAGHLLGPWWGALASFTGMMVAGSICYWGGRAWGAAPWLDHRAAPATSTRAREVGPVALLIARAAPMLPEALSAMAGARRMRASRYYLYFGLGQLPFALLVALAGSVSTLERPWPAVAAALAVPAVGAALMLWRRRRPSAG